MWILRAKYLGNLPNNFTGKFLLKIDLLNKLYKVILFYIYSVITY